jgi:hypothetical protein
VALEGCGPGAWAVTLRGPLRSHLRMMEKLGLQRGGRVKLLDRDQPWRQRLLQ